MRHIFFFFAILKETDGENDGYFDGSFVGNLEGDFVVDE